LKSTNTVPVKWIATLIDAGDGSGDKLIELPEELLARMDLQIGDSVKIDVSDDKSTLLMTKANLSNDSS
jgi:uncharacterized membrane protein (UPF0127 family)